MESFAGDFSTLWSLHQRPPIEHLTWDWWWWLVMIDDDEHHLSGKQLMVLWSTKENDVVHINDVEWKPKGTPGFDEEGAIQIDGMVCAWWFDGSVMHDEIIARVCDMVVLPSTHSSWPGSAGEGGGAVVPMLDGDCSMGMHADRTSFWLNLDIEHEAVQSIRLNMTPWNPVVSTAREATATYLGSLGYDILRLHGTQVNGTVDGEEVHGTAYFQKVCVQAPSVPWYWGVLHFSDGSYLDWFLPHLSTTILSRDSKEWKRRDVTHISVSQGGLFHDAKKGRSERFHRVTVEKQRQENDLPRFVVWLENDRTTIRATVCAVARAFWDFHQPTRGGIWSHLTYNEYPLIVESLTIQDEDGVRDESMFDWIRGNAEHSWGLLH